MWLPDSNIESELSNILTDMEISFAHFVIAVNNKFGLKQAKKQVYMFVKHDIENRKNFIKNIMGDS